MENRLDLFLVAPNPTWPPTAILEILNVYFWNGPVVRSFSFLILYRVGFQGRRINWRYIQFYQIEDDGHDMIEDIDKSREMSPFAKLLFVTSLWR